MKYSAADLDRLLQLAERVQLVMLPPNRINLGMISPEIIAYGTIAEGVLVIRANKGNEKIRPKMIRLSIRWAFILEEEEEDDPE